MAENWIFNFTCPASRKITFSSDFEECEHKQPSKSDRVPLIDELFLITKGMVGAVNCNNIWMDFGTFSLDPLVPSSFVTSSQYKAVGPDLTPMNNSSNS